MPLPPPSARKHLHTRKIDCQGFLREDGLWDIEGRIVDTKTYGFKNEWRGEMPPGTPVHDLCIRLTLDDAFTIRAVETAFDATPFRICPEVAPNFQRLVGLRIGRGWHKSVREHLKGTEGCIHLVELLSPLATVAFQTIRPYLRERVKSRLSEGEKDPTNQRPALVNTCYSWSSDREVVQRWMPEFHTGK